MKKVICPTCGMVNLEKFVTFPHCAACGALLSGAADAKIVVWRRPVNAILWATILGFCCVALAVAGILTARETRRIEERTLVVYVQIPRRAQVGKVSNLRMGLDSVEVGANESATFSNLQLRLPLAFLRDFQLISISPTPKYKIPRGNAVYFDFGNLDRESSLSILFKPRRAGAKRLNFSLDSFGFSNFEWRGSLQVDPATR